MGSYRDGSDGIGSGSNAGLYMELASLCGGQSLFGLVRSTVAKRRESRVTESRSPHHYSSSMDPIILPQIMNISRNISLIRSFTKKYLGIRSNQYKLEVLYTHVCPLTKWLEAFNEHSSSLRLGNTLISHSYQLKSSHGHTYAFLCTTCRF